MSKLGYFDDLSPLERNAVLESVYTKTGMIPSPPTARKKSSSPRKKRKNNNNNNNRKSPSPPPSNSNISPRAASSRNHGKQLPPPPPVRNSNRAVNGADNNYKTNASSIGRHPIVPLATLPKHEKEDSEAALRARKRREAERIAHDEAKRRKREEQEEAERRRREQLEKERLEREAKERLAAQRLRDETERKASEEAARLAKLEELRRQREEDERRRNEEAERKRMEEEERRKQEEEERRQRIEQEELDRRRREQQEREHNGERCQHELDESQIRREIETEESSERDRLNVEINEHRTSIERFLAERQQQLSTLQDVDEAQARLQIDEEENQERENLRLEFSSVESDLIQQQQRQQQLHDVELAESDARASIEKEQAEADWTTLFEDGALQATSRESDRKQREAADAAELERLRLDDDDRRKREEEEEKRREEERKRREAEEAERQRLADEAERQRRMALVEKALADAKAKAEAEEAARLRAEEEARLAALRAAAEKEEERRNGIREFFNAKDKCQPWHLTMPTERKEFRELSELMRDFRENDGVSDAEFRRAIDTLWPGNKLQAKSVVDRAFSFAAKDASGGIKDVDELIGTLQFACYANNLLPLFGDVSADGVGMITKQEFFDAAGSFEMTAPKQEWTNMFAYIKEKMGVEMDASLESVPFDLYVFWLSREKPFFDVEVEEYEVDEVVAAKPGEEM